MYNTLKSNKTSKKILTLFIGTSIFTFKRRNFFEYNQIIDHKQEFKKEEIKAAEESTIENELIPRFKLFNFDQTSIINMIYFPIQYSLFFFYETLSNKYMHCSIPDKKKPYLGCSIRFNAEFNGMRIINVKSDSPADKAGIKVNEVIVEIEGKRILSINDYLAAISSEGGEKTFRILKINDQGERTVETIKIDLTYES